MTPPAQEHADAMPRDAGTRILAWMGLGLKVPHDWEIRRHGISPDAGSLVFVDRRAQRMVLTWQRPKHEPDLSRTVEHARETVRETHPDLHVSPRLPSRMGEWRGFMYDLDSRVYRGVFYHREFNLLLEATLTLDGRREDTHRTVREVLGDLTVDAPPEQATRWRAFGVDCRVPESWTLLEAKVDPMDVRLRFDCGNKRRFSKTRSICEIRRMGMAGDWFDGDLHGFARSRAPGRRPRVVPESGSPAGAVRVDAERSRFFFLGPLGPKDRQAFRIWHAPEINSMLVLRLSNPGLGDVDLDAVRVETCPDAFSTRVPEGGEPQPAETPKTARDRLLDAVPVRNQAVSMEREPEGAVLRAPLRRRWWTRPPLGWFFPFRDTRGFGVDAFGVEVWEACDGNRTVRNICESFARRHAIGFAEARVAVYQFLRMLTKRELIVIQVAQDAGEAS